MAIHDKNEIIKQISAMSGLFSLYHVSRVGLFGSYLHNTQNDKSDIDLLIDFKEPVDLFSYVNLAEKLSISLKTRVDLVTIKGLKPALRDRILREVQWIEGL